MRSVTGATLGSNIANLYRDTGWVPLHDRRNIHSLCLLYKLFRVEGPSYLRDLLPPEVGERTDYRYPLRNTNDADIPFTRLDIFKRSFFPRTLSLWNKPDLKARKSPSLSVFKEGITPKPDKFEYFCHSCDWWAGIHHARIRIGCVNWSRTCIIIYMLLRRNHANVVTGVRIHSISFSNALVTLPCETIFSWVLHSIQIVHVGYKRYCLEILN